MVTVGPYQSLAEVYMHNPNLGFEGVLGDGDGEPANDLRLGPDGDVVSEDEAGDQDFRLGPFADAWRVTDAASLLPYGPGETTEDYTDRDHPARDAADVVADSPERARAETLRRTFGIDEGTLLQEGLWGYCKENPTSTWTGDRTG